MTVFFCDGPVGVESRPPENLHNTPPHVRVTLGAAETQDKVTAERYQQAIDKAQADVWASLRQVHQQFASSPEAKALANLEAVYKEAGSKLRQAQHQLNEAKAGLQSSMFDGSFTLQEQDRLRPLEEAVVHAKRQYDGVTAALEKARGAYRTKVQEEVEAVRRQIIAQSNEEYQRALEKLAKATIDAGLDLAVVQAVQLRFGGRWFPEDALRIQ
jgi:multidrug resistance efflux pump